MTTYLVNFWHLQKAHIFEEQENENKTKLFKITCIFSKILR